MSIGKDGLRMEVLGTLKFEYADNNEISMSLKGLLTGAAMTAMLSEITREVYKQMISVGIPDNIADAYISENIRKVLDEERMKGNE